MVTLEIIVGIAPLLGLAVLWLRNQEQPPGLLWLYDRTVAAPVLAAVDAGREVDTADATHPDGDGAEPQGDAAEQEPLHCSGSRKDFAQHATHRAQLQRHIDAARLARQHRQVRMQVRVFAQLRVDRAQPPLQHEAPALEHQRVYGWVFEIDHDPSLLDRSKQSRLFWRRRPRLLPDPDRS